ncbi:MAG: helix-turn-helix transcriptional regulator [Lachnospiraceae bacterium]|nr:helix-turn-helix transcriptional regulator [Lachnospiraceae bacterium]
MKTRVVSACDEELLFARNLRALRKKQTPYLSQRRLCQKLGVSRSAYVTYELGTRQAPAFFVANVAKYFGISADKLLREQLWKE